MSERDHSPFAPGDSTVGRDDSRRSDLAVMDVGEYKNKRRLERILDAHDNVEDVREQAQQAYVTGKISADARDITLLTAVQKFIRECYGMLLGYHQDTEGEHDMYWTGHPDDPIGILEFEETDRTEAFCGLRDIMYAPDYLKESWTEHFKPRNASPQMNEEEEYQTVPEYISWNGYLLLKRFLRDELGLDLEFEGTEYRSDKPGL